MRSHSPEVKAGRGIFSQLSFAIDGSGRIMLCSIGDHLSKTFPIRINAKHHYLFRAMHQLVKY